MGEDEARGGREDGVAAVRREEQATAGQGNVKWRWGGSGGTGRDGREGRRGEGGRPILPKGSGGDACKGKEGSCEGRWRGRDGRKGIKSFSLGMAGEEKADGGEGMGRIERFVPLAAIALLATIRWQQNAPTRLAKNQEKQMWMRWEDSNSRRYKERDIYYSPSVLL